MQINDAKAAALAFLGFRDEVEYLQFLGAVSDQVNDAWLQVAGAGSYNDQVSAYMLINGGAGNDFNSIQLSYWLSL